MKNKMMKLGMVATLVMAGMSVAQAADQPLVTITGDVSAISCTVNASASQNQIELGNYTSDKFTPGTGIYAGLFTVAASQRQFSVGVGGCTGSAAAAGNVGLKVMGTPIGGYSAVYNGGVGSTVGTAGASLAAPMSLTASTPDSLVNNGDVVPVFALSAAQDSVSANGSNVTFTTFMASGVETPAVQHIVAPISFSIAYN